MIKRMSNRKTVIRKAMPLAAGLIVSEISQSTSSAKTAANAIVVEKVKAEIRLRVGFEKD